MRHMIVALLFASSFAPSHALAADSPMLPGFRRSAWFDEQVWEAWVETGVRVLVNAPPVMHPDRPTRLVLFATPNGNNIEQTLGCVTVPPLGWHFDIQHVAAQIRRLREVSPGENIVLACFEAEGLSWPTWRRKTPDPGEHLKRAIEAVRSRLPKQPVRVTLTGHSGGGSFVFGVINANESIPNEIERIAFLDSNYAYADNERHGDKLLAWLRAEWSHRLIVIAYDDRKITLDGKLVVGPEGGTFRASQRMIDRFAREIDLVETKDGEFVNRTGLDGRISFRVHSNPNNKILHTVLVGEMNGVLQALTEGTPTATPWGAFGGPRAYTKWVQPAPAIPPRPHSAPGGAAVMARLVTLAAADREEAMAVEILGGNFPDFLRKFHSVSVEATDQAGKPHKATIEVMPDYLAVGSDADFVRIPMTPMTAQRIADAFGCALPTRKIVDEVYHKAAVKLEPRPMTEAREAVATFVEHNALIEAQRSGQPAGLLVAGIKKDIVVTNRLSEKPNRVAIYGWHKLDSTPIQPLNVNHRDTYVDYSHGVRLIKRTVVVDGKPRVLRPVMYAANLCELLSDEGPVTRPAY